MVGQSVILECVNVHRTSKVSIVVHKSVRPLLTAQTDVATKVSVLQANASVMQRTVVRAVPLVFARWMDLVIAVDMVRARQFLALIHHCVSARARTTVLSVLKCSARREIAVKLVNVIQSLVNVTVLQDMVVQDVPSKICV